MIVLCVCVCGADERQHGRRVSLTPAQRSASNAENAHALSDYHLYVLYADIYIWTRMVDTQAHAHANTHTKPAPIQPTRLCAVRTVCPYKLQKREALTPCPNAARPHGHATLLQVLQQADAVVVSAGILDIAHASAKRFCRNISIVCVCICMLWRT